MKYNEYFEKIASIKKEDYKEIKIGVISNITLEIFLKANCIEHFTKVGIYPELNFIDISDISKVDLEENKDLDLIVFWLNLNTLFPNIYNQITCNKKEKTEIIEDVCKYIETLLFSIKRINSLPTIWISFEDYHNSSLFNGYSMNNYYIADEINHNIKCRLQKISKFIDLKRIVAYIGIMNAYSFKNNYRWNLPYTPEVVSLVGNEICKQYLNLKGRAKKCVILDCDNVLWGGVISEDGKDKIKLSNMGIGKLYKDFQKYLLTLNNMGVILAICSKNDMEDVLEIFNNHDEMILKENNISCFKVNWDDKAGNILSISNQLNIGLENMVFVDDSIMEIDLVNSKIPEVTTILFDEETIFDKISNINFLLSLNNDDLADRMNTYKTNVLRDELRAKNILYNDYLAELGTKTVISEADIKEFSRISELSLRTNKCTNGVRYTFNELKSKLLDPNYKMYSVRVSDKFGSLGLVGAVGIYTDNGVLDLFSLSCRALGRNVENEMIDIIKKYHEIKSYRYNSTGKNDNILTLLKDTMQIN